jgi:hypothetical protein
LDGPFREVAWYENTDGLGGFGPQQLITNLADGVFSMFAADLDEDGDLDALSASARDDHIAWYENVDGLGSFGPKQLISSLVSAAKSVVATDLDRDVDGDADIDVLFASITDDEVAWHSNVVSG